MKRTAVIFVVLALVAAACGKKAEDGGSGGGSSGGTSEALANAATKLNGDQPYEMTFAMNFGGMPAVEGVDMSGMAMNGNIATDPANEATSFSFSMDTPEGESIPGVPAAAGGFSMDMIIIGEDAWISMPMISGLLGVDAKWIHMSTADLGPDFADMAGSPFGGSDPTAMLAGLGDAAGVTEAGTETIDGIETTKYEVTLDYGEMLSSGALSSDEQAQIEEALGSLGGTMDVQIPMTIWIDGEGLPRQIVMELPFGAMMGDALGGSEGGAEDASMTMTMNLVSYGENVSIQPPPANEVTEGSDIPGFMDAFGGGGATGGSGDIPDIEGIPTDLPEIPVP